MMTEAELDEAITAQGGALEVRAVDMLPGDRINGVAEVLWVEVMDDGHVEVDMTEGGTRLFRPDRPVWVFRP